MSLLFASFWWRTRSERDADWSYCRAAEVSAAALVLGIVGALTGAASLGWNIASHFLTAGRATVELRGAWITGTTYASFPIASFDVSKPPETGSIAALMVEIMNVGRLPVTVTECSVGIGPKIAYGEVNPARNPRIPYRLEVGDVARWVFDVADVLEVVDLAQTQLPDNVQVRGRGTVGAGKSQFSKHGVEPSRLRG